MPDMRGFPKGEPISGAYQRIPEDILIKRSILAALTSDAMLDNKPLWKRIEKEVTREFLDKIAADLQRPASGRLRYAIHACLV